MCSLEKKRLPSGLMVLDAIDIVFKFLLGWNIRKCFFVSASLMHCVILSSPSFPFLTLFSVAPWLTSSFLPSNPRFCLLVICMPLPYCLPLFRSLPPSPDPFPDFHHTQAHTYDLTPFLILSLDFVSKRKSGISFPSLVDFTWINDFLLCPFSCTCRFLFLRCSLKVSRNRV